MRGDLRATFNLTGHDVGQEPLVTEMAFCARECVRCTVAGPTRAGTVSLYASDLKAEQSSETDAGEDLMLSSRSLHHPQTQRDTLNQHSPPPPPRLSSGPRRDHSLFFYFLTSCLFLTHTQKHAIAHPYTLRWPGIGNGGVSTSLKQEQLSRPLRSSSPCNNSQKRLPLIHR